jgi:microsomal dipeptidase-like Zn-dependent dipeptidase
MLIWFGIQIMNYRIDNLQYCNWSRQIFEINREAKLDAVHVTIVYHEDYDELQLEIKKWKILLEENSDLIFFGKNFEDIKRAQQENKTAIFFGFQNCSPIEDDISLVEKVHELGCRFMQLTYNNQSLLATGCYEKIDSGVTNFGREVIREMNRVGIVIDMSHSAEKSTFEAIEISEKPIAITHANPSFWHPAKRNKSNDLLKTLNDSGGMLGLSLYPHHLKNNTECTLDSFCEMTARTAEIMNIKNIGIGSDLCLEQPNSIVEWMRNGTWSKNKNYGEGSKNKPGFPKQPDWFKDARGFENLAKGLKKIGFSENETNGILGNNWYNFYKTI